MRPVVHLLSSSDFHGAEAVVLELSRGQRSAGRDSSVVLLSTPSAPLEAIESRFNESGVPVDIVNVDGKLDLEALRALRRLLSNAPGAIVHSHKYKTTPYALLATRGADTHVVATFHNWLTDTRALRFYSYLDKRLARYCDACVAVSTPVLEELRRFVDPSKLSLVHNGVDTEIWKTEQRTRAPDAAIVVGFVGRLCDDKGIAELLEALAELPEVGGRPVEAMIVGDGDQAEAARHRAEQPDLRGRVEFLGTVSDMASVYAQLDVLALPSRNEGCPMVLLEAMSMRVPAVASPIGDIPSVVQDGTSGLLLSGIGADDIRAALEALLADEASLRRMGESARTRVQQAFSTETMVRRYDDVYGALRASQRVA